MTPQAFSEVLHWPQLCRTGKLMIQNNSSDEVAVWLQNFSDVLEREDEIDIPSATTQFYELAALNPGEHYSLLNFNGAAQVKISYQCDGIDYPLSTLEGGELTFNLNSHKFAQQLSQQSGQKLDQASAQQEQQIIWLQNIYPGPNTVKLEYLNFAFQVVSSTEVTLAPSQYSKVAPPTAPDWSYVRVSSDKKYNAFNLISSRLSPPVLISPVRSAPINPESASYFLVGPRKSDGDSFVVKITDTALIARARDLVQHPEKEKIVFGRVIKGSQGFNRNWFKKEKTHWSWSVSEVTNFDDIGSTACNGNPQFLEDRVDFWINDPGRICFWNYRIKKELTPEQVASGQP
jgi:hypothetical protein